MSIYPVYLARWYPKVPKRTPDLTDGQWEEWKKDSNHYHETAKYFVITSLCLKCKKKCTWKKAWGHHSLPFGYGDVWCSKKCLFGEDK